MAPLPRAARLLRSAVGLLRSPPPPPARLFSSAAGTGTGTGTGTGAGTGREAAIVATAVALAGSGLGLWLKPPSLADSGEAVGGQISVAGGGGAAEAREEKGRFLFAGERPVVPACVLLVCDLSVSVLAEGFNLIDGLARSGLGFSAAAAAAIVSC